MSPYRKNFYKPPWRSKHKDMFQDSITCPNCAGIRVMLLFPILVLISLKLGWCEVPPPLTPDNCVPGTCIEREDRLLHHGCRRWCPGG